ncbi:MAG TPA: tetratricopeptide repeat protein [Burkholderiaceae bacterium]|nr:tetratricopeptide repeat protein [Burkholderiaceae bacterium]
MAMATAAACGTVSAQDAAEKKGPVLAMHYGDTLFHFYQEHYFTAVTGLMVSQHFGRLSPHDDESEILRGGLLLSYGMHREAGQIFAQLIERGAPPSVRDRAWYFLAKIRYQRGDNAGAEQALGSVGSKLPASLEEDRGLLQANLLMARGDFAGAATVLQGMTAKSNASDYARFNLGVALVKGGDAATGRMLLDQVGQMPSFTEEQRSLRDKANVALGFAAMQDNRTDDARTALQRVRLESPQASRALLGLGWAEASAKQPARALVPWTELAGRAVGDAAVLEAKIGVPYAYAELGAFGQAHDGYQNALTQFDREHGALDESIAAIRSGKLVDALAAQNPGQEMGWFWSLATLPEMPHAAHLTPVLAQHAFQESFKNYRDLRFLERNLVQWRESLVAYRDMLANRRDAYAKRLPQAQAGANDGGGAIVALQARRDALAGEAKRVEAETDVIAFADPRQDALLQRMADVQFALKTLAGKPEIDALADKARLLAGALSWQLAQDFPARLWAAKKGLQTVDQQLVQAREREARLAAAQRAEPAKFDAFAKRIAELDARLAALTPRVAALAAEQQQEVQAIAVAELQGQQERLAEYRTQARFALAQLVDRALMAQTGDAVKEDSHAPRR